MILRPLSAGLCVQVLSSELSVVDLFAEVSSLSYGFDAFNFLSSDVFCAQLSLALKTAYNGGTGEVLNPVPFQILRLLIRSKVREEDVKKLLTRWSGPDGITKGLTSPTAVSSVGVGPGLSQLQGWGSAAPAKPKSRLPLLSSSKTPHDPLAIRGDDKWLWERSCPHFWALFLLQLQLAQAPSGVPSLASPTSKRPTPQKAKVVSELFQKLGNGGSRPTPATQRTLITRTDLAPDRSVTTPRPVCPPSEWSDDWPHRFPSLLCQSLRVVRP